MACRAISLRHLIVMVSAGLFCGAGVAARAADIAPLLTRAAAAAKGDSHAATIEALEQALENVRAEAPLTIRPFLLVTQPAKFYGDYTKRPSAVFQGGEPQRFYLEPKNLVSGRTPAGFYEPAFEVDLQILTAAGKVIADQARFGSFRLPTKSAVHDIFLNLTVSLTGAPPGDYNVRFVVRDLNSKKSATVAHPVTLK